MPIGSMLKQRDQQYAATRDERTRTWRILDTWSPSLQNLDADDEVPDDSPALNIITEGAFLALVKEATRLGVLIASVPGGDSNAITPEQQVELEEQLSVAEARVAVLEAELKAKPQEPPRSEAYATRVRAMDAVLRLAGMGELPHEG